MRQNDGIKLHSFIEIDKDIYKDNFKEKLKINQYIYHIIQKKTEYVHLRKR